MTVIITEKFKNSRKALWQHLHQEKKITVNGITNW